MTTTQTIEVQNLNGFTKAQIRAEYKHNLKLSRVVAKRVAAANTLTEMGLKMQQTDYNHYLNITRYMGIITCVAIDRGIQL